MSLNQAVGLVSYNIVMPQAFVFDPEYCHISRDPEYFHVSHPLICLCTLPWKLLTKEDSFVSRSMQQKRKNTLLSPLWRI